MYRLILVHIIFLLVALFVAFGLVPFDRAMFNNVPAAEISEYYENALTFKRGEAWKKVFTWFLGLSCARIVIKALMK